VLEVNATISSSSPGNLSPVRTFLTLGNDDSRELASADCGAELSGCGRAGHKRGECARCVRPVGYRPCFADTYGHPMNALTSQMSGER
jgi:hypothetical protein